MQRSILGFAGAALLAVACAGGAAQPCRYSAPRQVSINADGLKLLSVTIGPDHLVLRGERGTTSVTAHGIACASSAKRLQAIKLEGSRRGDTASLVARDGAGNAISSLFGGSYAYLKLEVQVPETLAIRLQQGSGDASIAGVAALNAVLGSGDLAATGVKGRLGLRVGSGDAKVSDAGSLDLASLGSGDVTADGIRGEAHAGAVGSGDLVLSNVTGNFALGSLASGDVKVQGVGGSLQAGSIGSGDLIAREVTGDITVRSVGSGDVRISDAGGNVRADSVGSGTFAADGVAGNFSVGAVGSGDLRHHGVKGRVDVPARN